MPRRPKPGRTPDLARVLGGKSVWLAYDPELNFVGAKETR